MENADIDWIKENNAQHQWHPMNNQNAVQANPPLIIDGGDGVYIKDIDGKQYLDCQGGLWCVNAGHGRKEIIDATKSQLDKLQYYTLFPGSTNSPSIELSTMLTETLAVENMTKAFFTSGGSDSVETAIKVIRQYWKLKGQADRIKIFSFKNGYHGVHFGGLSAGGHPAWKRAYEPLLPGFYQVDVPYLYRNDFTDDHDELGEICLRRLENEILHQGPDTVAAILAEPVLGAGGVIIPPSAFWPGLRELCDKYDLLLVADEVITGLGRSGSLFGCRGWGVKPDIMTLAKGLTSGYIPLGACMINEKIEDAWKEDSPLSVWMQGYTYSGHPVACAAGIAALKLMHSENHAENAREVGNYLLQRLLKLKDNFTAIGDVRGKGLMLAIELVKDRDTKEPFEPTDEYPPMVSGACESRGVIIRCIVNKLIISPPLIFTKEHADVLADTLEEAFKSVPYNG
jgi:putrescine---pyruvate transaminase